jgi:cation:H+ antiporter
MYQAWFIFFISALLVYLAGSRLTASAAVIARETGLGGLWVGLIILPLSTSLPELVSSWRAVSIGALDLAVGNFLGSNLFNLFIISLIDLVQGKGSVFTLLSRHHRLAVKTVVLMTFLVLAGLLLPAWNLSLSPVTPLLLLAYLAAGRRLYRSESQGEGGRIRSSPARLARAVLSYLAASAVIIFAAVNLADAADTLAAVTGLGRTFIGSFLLAVSTSLPEVVTTTTAARLGFLDMAVGNVLGANMFNLLLLFPLDVVYREGPLLQGLSPLHLFTGGMGIGLAFLVYLGLARPSRVLLGDLGLNSLLIAAGYALAIGLLYAWGTGF